VVRGEPWPGDNPRLALDPDWHDLVRLWYLCRGESGIAHWPDPGGLADQAAWLVEAFAALSSIDATWRAEDLRNRGG
jgi:hypothetical protein